MATTMSKRWVWAAALALAAGCSGKKGKSKPTDVNVKAPSGKGAVQKLKPEGDGLAFRLSEGAPDDGAARNPVAAATPLDDAAVTALLARLPAMAAAEADVKDFALREKSLPVPRTGDTVKTAFPPPPGPPPPDVAVGPLEVLRHAPDGEVNIAANLSVTFSQPMVAVTSHDATIAGGVPVKLSPEVAGKWRWVGTKTVLFEPERRFPMATDFTVTVPAGTTALGGGALAKEQSFKFSTPPLNVIGEFPSDGPVQLQPVIFVRFDQAIDPAAVLRTIKLTQGQSAPVALRLASAAEITADPTVKQLVAAGGATTMDGNTPVGNEVRWLAFRPVQPLPGDSLINLAIGPGTPSAEGPRVTTEAATYSFRTFGPMKMTGFRCGWNMRCPPGTPFQMEFSNPIDAKKFKPAMLTVTPAIPNMKAVVYGDTLNITGAMKGRTTYKVTVGTQLPDSFGQTLAKAEEATFVVGSAEPSLAAGGKNFVILDPSAKPRFTIYTINQPSVKLQVYAVGAGDLAAYGKWSEELWREDGPKTPPFKRIKDEVVTIKGDADELTETQLELGPSLTDGLGQVVVLVESTLPPRNKWDRNIVHAWVQATQLGLGAFVDDHEMIAWASKLKDGAPLAGVELSVGEATATTGADGLARLPLSAIGARGSNVLVARQGKDVALLPEGLSQWGWYWNQSSWREDHNGEALRWFVFDDRHMYKPGEEVHLKGWLRRVDLDEGGDLVALGAVTSVDWSATDSRGNVVAKGVMPVNAAGGFDTSYKLPPTMNLGWSNISLHASGGVNNSTTTHTVEVQEFRRPEFEVSAHASAGPHIVGGYGTFSVDARYYSGGALPGAEVTWTVTSSPGSFTPPNQDDFTFGTWTPWWGSYHRGGWGGDYDDYGYGYGGGYGGGNPAKILKASTGSEGAHHLRVDFDAVGTPRAQVVNASAQVMDVNRQAWVASSSTVVHPASEYVGLKSKRTFVDQGQDIEIDAIVADLEGKRVKARSIAFKTVRLDWVQEEGNWKEKEVDPQTCKVTSGQDPVRCSFKTKVGGSYKVRATIQDSAGRDNQSELTIWVAGGKQPPQREVAQQEVTLIPDRKEYQPGDKAEVLVQAPFSPAEGVVTIRRSGIVKVERFSMKGTSHKLSIPIEEGWLPGVQLQVDLVGAAQRVGDDGKVNPRLPPRPAYAMGALTLPIPPRVRTLKVAVTPAEDALDPGASTAVTVEVKDAAGQPVAGAEVALVVVDEAVLALSNYSIADPVAVFYSSRAGGGRDYHSRSAVLLANPDRVVTETASTTTADKASNSGMLGGFGGDKPGMPAPAPVAAAEAAPKKEAEERGRFADDAKPADGKDRGGQATTPIAQRTNFDPLASFTAASPTDAAGRASVTVKLPDNLTRYRITAVVVEGDRRFGKGESQLTARLPLQLRPSPPRFLNFGDKFELPIVIQNQTKKAIEVQVAVRAHNAELTAGQGRLVTVPASDRVEVRFPAAAARAGTARFQVGISAGSFADAASFELPVWTPATTEAFATYGDVAGDKPTALHQPVAAPPDVWPQFGGLEVQTSSTQLQALTDAVLYLVAYPYECAEQLSSRILAVAALKDVLGAFDAEGLPSPEKILARMSKDLERLRGMQNSDGGFGFWKRGDDSWPFLSIHVTHALSRAKDKGFTVNAGMLAEAHQYLKEIESHYPWYYSLQTRRVLTSYALYVRARLGDRDTARARKLIDEAGLDGLGAEAVGWLWSVLAPDAGSAGDVAKIRTWVQNHVTEEAGTAHFVTSYSDGAHLLLASDRRADGILLEAMIDDTPDSDLIAKVVRGLLAHRKRGAWSNTQENAFVLLALDRYFHVYEKTTPNFVARVWLGDAYAGDHAFKGRTTERHQIDIPMQQLVALPASQDLTIGKEGAGRLYYRIGMQYAPKSLKLEPSEHGFTVERSYEAVDDPGDVKRDANGVWHVKAGAKVRVRLTMVAQARRYHVALVDQLPAGLEPMNPALAVTGAIPADDAPAARRGGGRSRSWEEEWWWWRGTWYEHQNMRDERVEAFTSLLWEGVHAYSYVARATTPGNFVVPPAKAEEMYAPETFGRSASDALIVE